MHAGAKDIKIATLVIIPFILCKVQSVREQ